MKGYKFPEGKQTTITDAVKKEETEDKMKIFYDKLQSCELCELCKLDVNNLSELRDDYGKLQGEGSHDSKILFVAQSPSYFRKGKVFLSTQNTNNVIFLDALKHINIKREDVFVTNLTKCSQFENEQPKKEQIDKCKEHLFFEINEINPNVIVAVGSVAANFLDVSQGAILCKTFLGRKRIFCAIRHPSYVLRGGISKERYLKEFEIVLDTKKHLGELRGG